MNKRRRYKAKRARQWRLVRERFLQQAIERLIVATARWATEEQE